VDRADGDRDVDQSRSAGVVIVAEGEAGVMLRFSKKLLTSSVSTRK
jgi:hypothetical protein